jgi:hypothetical protein
VLPPLQSLYREISRRYEENAELIQFVDPRLLRLVLRRPLKLKFLWLFGMSQFYSNGTLEIANLSLALLRVFRSMVSLVAAQSVTCQH